ncbi:MAG: MalY/PatB family protein [Paraclostridium sordellii]
MYNFEDILYREENGSKKWNKEYINKRFPKHKTPCYPLFIADMDYKLPDEILSKFINTIQYGDFGYFDVLDKFNESIVNWYKNLNDIDIDKKLILPGIGTLASMNIVVKALLNKNDNILIFTPVYGPFKDIVENNGLNLVKQKLDEKNNRYYIDFEKLEANIIQYNLKCILMCNPHNPSGRVWSYEEIKKIVSLCKKYKLILLSDEVHSDLVLDRKFVSMVTFVNEYENIIVSSSPNKTFNLAGVCGSYLLIKNKDIYNKVQCEFTKNKLGINRLGYEFMTSCYENGQNWVNLLREKIKEHLNILESTLVNKGIQIMIPEAGYLVWVRLDKVNDSLTFVEELARETGVLLESGTRFIESENGYVRINLATSRCILEKAMKELDKFYDYFIKKGTNI